MKKWVIRILIALPLVVAGVVSAHALTRPKPMKVDGGFICPITGEELPCPKCCPLNRGQ